MKAPKNKKGAANRRAKKAANRRESLPSEKGGGIVVLCVLDDPEHRALESAFKASSQCNQVLPARKFRSEFDVRWKGDAPVRVTLVSVGTQGNLFTAIETMNILARYRPRLLIFCGIAGLMNPEKVRLGDVVVQDSVYAHAYTKKVNRELQPTKLDVQTVPSLADYRRDFHYDRKEVFNGLSQFAMDANGEKAVELNEGKRPRLLVGKYLVTDYVLDCEQTRDEFIANTDRNFLCIETESYGLLSAADNFRNKAVPGDVYPLDVVVIRGLSDRAAKKGASDSASEGVDWRDYAARNAACVTIDFICGLKPDDYKLGQD